MNFFESIFPNYSCFICKAEMNERAGTHICGECAETLPYAGELFGAVAPFFYKSPVVELILRFKYNSEGDIAKLFAPFMADVWKGEADIIVPVPLSKERLKSRGYNQALLLAKELSAVNGITVGDALVRVKKTTPQKNMAQKQRQENLKNAFRVADVEIIKGKRVLLVDDVYTTGATAAECTRMLKKAGAIDVQILTAARVI